MQKEKGRRCTVRALAVVLLIAGLAVCTPPEQAPAQISDFHLEPTSVSVAGPAQADLYYCLLHGDGVSSITSTVDVTLTGTNGIASFRHEPGGGLSDPQSFYAVLGVPLSAPMDTDGDGIDDVFELGFNFLDPLNPADAPADADEDGVSNLREYRQGRDLTVGAIPGTSGNVGLVVFAPPAW